MNKVLKKNFLYRNPNFVLLWVGQILSQSGGRMYQMAMIWWILSIGLEGSGKYVGLFMVMAALPSILLVKKIGNTIDNGNSKRILVTCDVLAASIVGLVGLLVFKNWLALPFAFVAGFVAATLQAHIDPTLNRAIQEIVPPEDVEGAVSLLASTQSMANFTGAVAGAVLIDRMGIYGTAWMAAMGYVISSIATGISQFKYREIPSDDPESVKKSQLSGWSILTDYPLLKRILIGFGLINFFATPTLVVLPIYTKKTLMGSASTLGTLEASLWIGLLLGALGAKYIHWFESRIKLGAFCLVIFGLGLGVPGLVTNVPVYMVALFVAGAALGVNNVKFISYFQEVVAPELKGRFFALMQALIGFTFPIAYFLFGWLTDLVDPPTVCLIQGFGVIALAIYFASLAREESQTSGLQAVGVS